MSKKIKNIIIYSLVSLIILLVLLYKFLPAHIIFNTIGKDNIVSSVLCAVPVKVSGESMEPFLKSDKRINLTNVLNLMKLKKIQ
jgi:signal peptidase I